MRELPRTNFLPMSYTLDEETREKKLLINDRVGYGLRKGQLSTSIRWLLKGRGIELEKPFGEEGGLKLRELKPKEIGIRFE